MLPTYLLDLFYLIAAVTFVVGLRMLSHPDSARRGNQLAAIGMGLAVLGTLFLHPSSGRDFGDSRLLKLGLIYGALALGGLLGWRSAYRVKMTSMPQMVSLFNGLGGGCAALLAIAEMKMQYGEHTFPEKPALVLILFTLFFGAVSLTGSLLAYLKLEDKIKDSSITLPRHTLVNLALLAVILGLIGYTVWGAGQSGLVWGLVLFGIALVYGFSFVAPIGGADMPVVISVLNSCTGLTAAAAGIIYDNLIMLVGGILVGASGSILTILMCKAMNRSLSNVLIGSFGGTTAGAAKAVGDQVVKEISLPDAAVLLNYSASVVIVPGYGLAVAQAQKICKELDDLLDANGVEVRYAIHPVAGRMPGHMNVLLAEADVPYPKLFDLEEANDHIAKADTVIVIGANDVVNPAALDDPSSPIYGMPVLEVWQAKNVIVMKRSMKSGYAGIENDLFFHAKTKMLFGDAKDTLQKLVAEVKAL
jgi:H+-translocating NAD(P) transhydrogenase subunit beta